jgi:DNA-binding NtrC family response regulator
MTAKDTKMLSDSTSQIHSTLPVTILFVDDEQSILNSLKRLFRREAYNILTALNPAEALSVINHHEIAVVICDFNMPGGSGADLLEMVQTKHPHCVRIMLTGATDAQEVPEGIIDGILHCQRVLTKPWNDQQLVKLVADSVAEYRKNVEKG